MTDFRPPIERTQQRPRHSHNPSFKPKARTTRGKASSSNNSRKMAIHLLKQPVFQGQGQNNQGQRQQQQQQLQNGYTPAQGYFINHSYPSNNQQNNQYLQPAQQGYAQPSCQSRGAPGNADSTTNGLVHQFSHQNLGGAARGNQYARQPAGAQRPQPTGVQQNYYNAAAAPVVPQQPEFEPAPERNPDKYGPLIHNNQKRCAQLASDFFKDSVKRARDRNLSLCADIDIEYKGSKAIYCNLTSTWSNDVGEKELSVSRQLQFSSSTTM
ncbi:hypothetical protein V490_00316 [Pseudogymnoascus sp. VKM F-3557]|nr:hypothetical protein V490_00316 [Pseudogymnoascus sp. VKM F-3557]